MRHSQIEAVAKAAAHSAYFIDRWPDGRFDLNDDAFRDKTHPTLPALYAYARERKFPPAETLARKLADLQGVGFGHASLATAPSPVRAFFTVFRAVAEALEPMYEADTPESLAAAERLAEEKTKKKTARK